MKILKYSFCVFVAGIALFLDQIVQACSFGPDPYEQSFVFFANNLTDDPAFQPFYFVEDLRYYNTWGGLDDDEKDKPGDQNLTEWLAYLHDPVDPNDAAQLIYRLPYASVEILNRHLREGKGLTAVPDSLRRNTMAVRLFRLHDREALQYLLFAKQCEKYTGSAGSDWEAPQRNAVEMIRLAQKGHTLWAAAKKPFFKERYAFQILRLTFYANRYQETLAAYQRLIGAANGTSSIFYRCLSLKAGAHYRLGQFSEAAYLYARSFDAGGDREKFSNFVSFQWCFATHESGAAPAAARHVLALCRTDHERATIYLMHALHVSTENDNGWEALQSAYNADPGIRGLSVAMARQINMIENDYLRYRLDKQTFAAQAIQPKTSYHRYYKNHQKYLEEKAANAKAQIADMLQFCHTVFKEKQAADPAFWATAGAYLCYLNEDWPGMKGWIDQAAQSNPSAKVAEMIAIEKVLLAVKRNSRIDNGIENALLADLEALEKKASGSVRADIIYDNLLAKLLPAIYLKQGDTTRAALCVAKAQISGRYPSQPIEPAYFTPFDHFTIPALTRLDHWLSQKNNKTPFEKWLTRNPLYLSGTLKRLIASRHILNFQFDRAVAILEQLPDSLLAADSFEDPFKVRWKDSQMPVDDGVFTTNRLTFAKEMARLQQHIRTGSPEDVFRYANGLYSMTYYGIAWKAGQYYRSGADPWAYYANENRHRLVMGRQKYYDASEAAYYYQKAFERSRDSELRAKCLFMLSKCWQKSAPDDQQYHFDPKRNTGYMTYTLQSPYFQTLVAQYSKTNTFRNRFEDCAYLRYFVAQNK